MGLVFRESSSDRVDLSPRHVAAQDRAHVDWDATIIWVEVEKRKDTVTEGEDTKKVISDVISDINVQEVGAKIQEKRPKFRFLDRDQLLADVRRSSLPVSPASLPAATRMWRQPQAIPSSGSHSYALRICHSVVPVVLSTRAYQAMDNQQHPLYPVMQDVIATSDKSLFTEDHIAQLVKIKIEEETQIGIEKKRREMFPEVRIRVRLVGG